MPPAPSDTTDGRVTLRDLARVEATQEKILAEVSKLQQRLDGRFEAHQAKHETEQQTHEVNHRREADRRAGYLRWAVTTIMTGAGVLVALFVALRS